MSVQELRALGEDPLGLLIERLRALDGEQLEGLERGLHALAAGDFTQVIEVRSVPIGIDAPDAQLRALVDLINGMLVRTQGALSAYETLRADLGRALGDRSCLPELLGALRSLDAHCLTDLDTGLQAMADGDLTHAARPVTGPLRSLPGDAIGEVAEVFNDMLARSRTALRSYDAVREDLRVSLGDTSCLDELRARLRSLQRHCLRDLEEALEAIAQGTTLTRRIAPATLPIETPADAFEGELAALFNRALARARAAVEHLSVARDGGHLSP